MRQCCPDAPNPHKPFVLETDASSIAVGALLKQLVGDEEVSTLFYSLAINSARGNYSAERELLALMKGCDAVSVFFFCGHVGLRP